MWIIISLKLKYSGNLQHMPIFLLDILLRERESEREREREHWASFLTISS